ncbi:MAG: hypothetical protein OEV28_10240 [Nitrospirota bacterium]|nr:hypothetical protein [Nitrospirota bacterium]
MAVVTFPDQRIEAVLTFALRLTDAFTGLEPRGSLVLALDGVRANVPRNRSGYWLFLNLPLTSSGGGVATYRLEVRSDFYVTQVQEDIRPGEMDRSNPVVSLNLEPLPSYPFSAGSTLIRGVVQDDDGNPIEGATVEIRHSSIETTTTASGEFVLYFRQITPDDVEIVGGKRLMVVNNSTNLRIRANHPDFKHSNVDMQVEEGQENSVGGAIQLEPK